MILNGSLSISRKIVTMSLLTFISIPYNINGYFCRVIIASTRISDDFLTQEFKHTNDKYPRNRKVALKAFIMQTNLYNTSCTKLSKRT